MELGCVCVCVCMGRGGVLFYDNAVPLYSYK